MKSNFHLLFYLRKQKNYKGGPMAVYMRITVDGKRVEMSAGRECDPAKWNSHAGRAIGAKEEIKSLNNYLDSLLIKVRNAHQVLIDANQRITTESLQNQFTGKTEKNRYLMQLFAEHNAKVKCDIQQYIDEHDLSIKIMQTYANFTVGGALSVNAHGRYMGMGPVVLSVRSIDIVLADGSLIHATKTKNQEIFFGEEGLIIL